MDVKSTLRLAASVPGVPLFGQVVATAVMSGAKMLPEDLWERTSKVFSRCLEEEDVVLPAGSKLKVHDNNARSNPHECRVYQIISTLQQEVKPQQAVWYIPVDELASLVNEDPDEDYMDITVLTFVGTEKELRKEVSKLCDYYEVKFVQES
jgi:hypothetical protein